jgi:hypothetical protein
LADSRDPDVRFFNETQHKLIDFQTKTVSDYNVPSKEKEKGKENSIFFVVNEGNFFIIKDKDGKQVADNEGNNYKIKGNKGKNMINLNAKEVRISPKGNKIAYLRKDDVLVCAELFKDNNPKDPKPNEVKHEREVDLANIEDAKDFINGYKGNLSQVFWIANGLLAIGKFIGYETPPQEFLIIRARNGKAFCKFNLKGEYSFEKNSSQPNLFSPCCTGILDRRSNKLYDISGLSLIHLGAKRFNLGPNSPEFREDSELISKSDKILVLGLLTPALFLPSLK